jgi:hypothetical protein
VGSSQTKDYKFGIPNKYGSQDMAEKLLKVTTQDNSPNLNYTRIK